MTEKDKFNNPESRHNTDELHFRYRGEDISIPIVNSQEEIQALIIDRVLSGMERMASVADAREKGVGFAPYLYSSDDFDVKYPEATAALKEIFRKAGLLVSDKNRELDPIQPRRRHLISTMRENPDQSWSRDALKNTTFLLGPIASNTLRLNWPFSTEEDNKATALALSSTIAIDGYLMLGNDPPDRISNAYIIKRLESFFPLNELT